MIDAMNKILLFELNSVLQWLSNAVVIGMAIRWAFKGDRKRRRKNAQV